MANEEIVELSQALWALKLKGSRKIHLAESDEERVGIGPAAVTLCGKAYDPADRVGATKGKWVKISICQACLLRAGYVDPLKKLLNDAGALANALKKLGLSDEDFSRVLQECLKIREEQARLRQSQGGA